MRLLLDTNVLIRVATAPATLQAQLHHEIHQADQIWFSSIVRAEIAIKLSIRKLMLPTNENALWNWMKKRLQAQDLPFKSNHGRRLVDLPLHHRDPFDRMIVAQCLEEDLALATTDELLGKYGVKVLG